MNSSPDTLSWDDDHLLGKFLARLEQSEPGERDGILDQYCQQHPERASEFRELAVMRGRLERLPTLASTIVPATLGDFRIGREIAHGGMGTVFEATQMPLDRRVAVKVIRQKTISQEWRDRFLREQKVLATLHHSHIVPVFSAGSVGELHYFAMPLIVGASLNKVVAATRDTTRSGVEAPELSVLAKNASGHQASTIDGFRSTSQDRTTPTQEAPSESIDPEPVENGGGSGNHSSTRVTKGDVDANGRQPHGKRLRGPLLSSKYLRSVALAIADVADAVQHAHDHGFIHRDLKPSNLMIDGEGHCWIIDFGLAGLIRESSAERAEAVFENVPAGVTAPDRLLGTLHYMAPEQFEGSPDGRTDVWGLGTTLYELLTLHPAVDGKTREEIQQRICSRGHPVFEKTHRLPGDLKAICRKALAKRPEDRYQQAGGLADDLRCWVRGEPPKAAKAGSVRRSLLWARRNPGWAATFTLIAVGMCACVLTIGSILFARASGRAESIQRLFVSLIKERDNGWSTEAWQLVAEATRFGRNELVRDNAARTLSGIDASVEESIDAPASSVQFDAKGTRVIFGGTEKTPAMLWEDGKGLKTYGRATGSGPVAFDRTGRPVQLVSRSLTEFNLWDVDAGEREMVWKLPMDGEPAPIGFNEGPTMALSIDGQLAAVSVRIDSGDGVLAIWNRGNRQPMHTLSVAAAAIAFSPDSKLMATGSRQGDVQVWDIETGVLATQIRLDGIEITSLAFAKNRIWPKLDDDGPLADWLLASGDAGGRIAIWHLGRGRPLFICRGHQRHVFDVEFSPDGVTFASSGRFRTILWDIATGNRLLEILTDYATMGLAFSPNGSRLASVNRQEYDPSQQRLRIWKLDNGRGVSSLRGLSNPVAQVAFSSSGNCVAALSDNWRAAVWESESRKLTRVLDVPDAQFSDNAAIALDADGTRVAIAAGRFATLWDIESGDRLNIWEFPSDGLQDQLAFTEAGELLSFRYETPGTSAGPFVHIPWQEYPRVCRIRNLFADAPLEPIWEEPFFARRLFDCSGAADGSRLLVQGLYDTQEERRAVRVYEWRSGKRIWEAKVTIDSKLGSASGSSAMSSDGRLFAFREDAGNRSRVHRTTDGSLVARAGDVSAISSSGQYFSSVSHLFHIDDPTMPCVRLRQRPDTSSRFDASGTRLLWGNTDGTVQVCDIEAVRKQLNQLGLGWTPRQPKE